MLDTPTADVGHPLRQLRIVVQGKGAYIRKMGAGIICRSEDLVGNIRRGRQHNSVILQWERDRDLNEIRTLQLIKEKHK